LLKGYFHVPFVFLPLISNRNHFDIHQKYVTIKKQYFIFMKKSFLLYLEVAVIVKEYRIIDLINQQVLEHLLQPK
jgi:hypothetical protein